MLKGKPRYFKSTKIKYISRFGFNKVPLIAVRCLVATCHIFLLECSLNSQIYECCKGILIWKKVVLVRRVILAIPSY